MDLFKPTYEALNFWGNNLSAGEYIFVHDYYVWDGIEAFVEKEE